MTLHVNFFSSPKLTISKPLLILKAHCAVSYNSDIPHLFSGLLKLVFCRKLEIDFLFNSCFQVDIMSKSYKSFLPFERKISLEFAPERNYCSCLLKLPEALVREKYRRSSIIIRVALYFLCLTSLLLFLLVEAPSI